MNVKQNNSLKVICEKLGDNKINFLINKLQESKKQDITIFEIQEWTRLPVDYSNEFLELLNSFQCMETLCIAMEMQNKIETKKLEYNQQTKLIMTGPLSGKNIGHTLGNYKSLIENAKKEIILVGYVFNNIHNQMDSIVESLLSATSRGVSVKIFFEKGKSSNSLRDIWKNNKNSKLLELYVYKPKEKNSVLHAKSIIQDNYSILVTSANMTGSAMTKNIELGILYEGKLASEARKMFINLIDEGYVIPVP
jgi:phosphatidylserine/phosphatidylglycerophosphate/cardiolipin synthase-like enzyme